MKKMLLLAMAASASMAVLANDVAQARQCSNLLDVDFPAKSVAVNGVLTSAKKAGLRMSQPVKTLAEGDVTAYYDLPNMFYMAFGVPETGTNWYPLFAIGEGGDYAHGSAFVDLPFVNASTGATQFTWTYQDPATYENATSNEQHLILNYGYAQVDAPSLTASNGSDEDTYVAASMLMFGGQSAMRVSAGDTEPCPFYDNPDNVGLAADYTSLGLGKRRGIAGVGEKIGLIYPEPFSPYCFSKIYVYAAVDFGIGTELSAEIYTLDEDANLSAEPIATATFIAASDYTSTAGEGQVSVALLEFNVQIFDGILYSDGYVTIDSPMAILFNSNPANVNTFDPMVILNEYTETTPAWIGYVEDGVLGIGVWGVQGAGYENLGTTSFTVGIDATFAWLSTSDGSNTVTVPNNGGSVNVPLESYWYTTALNVAEDEAYDGTISDWASYEFADTETGSSITITADALPAGVEGRSCTCTIEGPGIAPLKLTINQGTTGITAVTTSAAKVSVEGGNFVVTAPEAINAATVYNIAGQAVAASEIAGTTTIDGSSLAKGVYIVRFNDGSSVKVVK